MQSLSSAVVAAGMLALAISAALAQDDQRAAPRRARVVPSIVRLEPGHQQRFRVVLEPGWLQPARVATKVVWAVNGIVGGDARVGTIDGEGDYSAPARAPKPCEVHICATAAEAANPKLWATAIVGDGEAAYRLVSKWEEPADGSVHLKSPAAIAVEADGSLLIADLGCSRVYRYSPDGKLLGAIGGENGPGTRSFENPRAVAVGANGDIYVSDMRTGPPRIQVFARDGRLLRAFAVKGVGPGQVMQTQAMAVDPAGRLLAADTDNMRVTIYAVDGTLVDTWDRNGVLPGQVNEPYGVVVDANGDVFVPGFYGPCQKFTAAGDLLFAFARPGPPHGIVAITSAAGDRWGNVYLTVRDAAGLVENTMDPEPKAVKLLKFNNCGDLVASVSLWDDERGENPMAVDAQDRVYIAFKRGKTAGVAVFEPR